jgi:diaminopimelate decarboxylase
MGLSFDASSSYEAEMLMREGVAGEKISLSSQQPAHNLEKLLEQGVQYVATSIHQLELFINAKRETSRVGLRVNPNVGSGEYERKVTGGVNSSFGLWHEYIDKALKMAADNEVIIDRLHVHIGSGADPSIWEKVLEASLEIVDKMPDVVTLDIGGGYKVHRYGSEQETDMNRVGQAFSSGLAEYADRTSRKLKLEIEPGTWLVVHSGILLAEVVDMVDTGRNGHRFLRLNTGMNDILRPSIYGAMHEIFVLSEQEEEESYIVVGHNCETGDILTPAAGNPEDIESRKMKRSSIGDVVAIMDTGAYCASFSVHGYNAFPSAKEVVIKTACRIISYP